MGRRVASLLPGNVLALLIGIATAAFAASPPDPPSSLIARLELVSATVTDSRSVPVRVTLENRTPETQSVLRRQTPFAPSFDGPAFVVDRDGEPLRYVGRMVKYAPPREEDFLVLAPGDSQAVTIDIAGVYDLSAPGTYHVHLAMLARGSLGTPALGAAGADRAWHGVLSSNEVVFTIAGAAARAVTPPYALEAAVVPMQPNGVGTVYQGCTASEQAAIDAAMTKACFMATKAQQFSCSTGSCDGYYIRWFGACDVTRGATVCTHYGNIASAFCGQTTTVYCHGDGCSSGTYAYTYPTQVPPTVYLCDGFWAAPMDGFDSRPGTLIHEMSHLLAVAGTDDYVYGQSGCQSLAITTPAQAIMNADSHEYYAEDHTIALAVPAARAPGVNALRPARPNPVRGGTTLDYVLASGAEVELAVWSLDGRCVRVLDQGWRTAGPHASEWDGRDASGRRAPAGVYFVRLRAPLEAGVQRLVVIR